MKLRKFAEHINNIAITYPNAEVLYSIDDEGNQYNVCCNEPCMCRIPDNSSNYDVDVSFSIGSDEKFNAVCIN